MIDQEKYRKQENKCKQIEHYYHVQENNDVTYKGVKMLCNTTQFPPLPLCGKHVKPHLLRGMRKKYHMRLYPKLGHGTCEIC